MFVWHETAESLSTAIAIYFTFLVVLWFGNFFAHLMNCFVDDDCDFEVLLDSGSLLDSGCPALVERLDPCLRAWLPGARYVVRGRRRLFQRCCARAVWIVNRDGFDYRVLLGRQKLRVVRAFRFDLLRTLIFANFDQAKVNLLK
mgnify:CR=1 FL=1